MQDDTENLFYDTFTASFLNKCSIKVYNAVPKLLK